MAAEKTDAILASLVTGVPPAQPYEVRTGRNTEDSYQLAQVARNIRYREN